LPFIISLSPPISYIKHLRYLSKGLSDEKRLALARKELIGLLDKLNVSYDPDSAGFRRAVEALARGRRVSINYDDGHFRRKARKGFYETNRGKPL